jgi:hypothetical protein
MLPADVKVDGGGFEEIRSGAVEAASPPENDRPLP